MCFAALPPPSQFPVLIFHFVFAVDYGIHKTHISTVGFAQMCLRFVVLESFVIQQYLRLHEKSLSVLTISIKISFEARISFLVCKPKIPVVAAEASSYWPNFCLRRSSIALIFFAEPGRPANQDLSARKHCLKTRRIEI